MNVKIEFEPQNVAAKIASSAKKGIFAVTNEFIKDANFFCRMDTGELIKSSLRASQPEKGLAIWDKSYAREVYYLGHPAVDKNPNARLEWARAAAGQNQSKYQRMFDQIAKGAYK